MFATATVGVLSGCGSSSNPPTTNGAGAATPAAYVKSLCGAIGPFERDIQARGNALTFTTRESTVQQKQALARFLETATADTQAAVSQLSHAGAPSVSGGKQLATVIVLAFSKLSMAFGNAAAQMRTLPTNNRAAFQRDLEAISLAVRGSIGSIGLGLSGLRNPELQKAAQKEPACSTLSA